MAPEPAGVASATIVSFLNILQRYIYELSIQHLLAKTAAIVLFSAYQNLSLKN
jgi:hypothetical protein